LVIGNITLVLEEKFTHDENWHLYIVL
jgi:hypothetical protein